MIGSYIYKCVFMLDGDRTEVCGVYPSEFQQGFWLDADYHITGGLSGKYWIPPHQIIFIVKEEAHESIR